MKTWTPEAERRLVEYLEARARREGFDGVEAEELKDDWKRHLYEEAEDAPGDSIGLMQLEGLLARLGVDPGPAAAPAPASVPAPLSTPPQAGGPRRKLRVGSWLWGVIAPVLVLAIELITAFCGGVFFDPLATWWHVALVAMVPLANAWLLSGKAAERPAWRGAASGFSLIIAGFYGLLFLPLLPMSLLALIWLGLGLLSLTPLLAGLWTWLISRRLIRGEANPARFRRGRRYGLALGLLALLVLEGPAIWTRANLAAAADEDAQPAIRRLRVFHSERTLLRACYEGNRGSRSATDIAGWLGRGWQMLGSFAGLGPYYESDSQQTRDLFFRVTGKPFNSLKPPRMVRQDRERSIGRNFNELEFDRDLGGDQVAVRLKDLDLTESRFDGHLDARSAIGYGEWTLVFHNRGAMAREARCQVQLPRGGRVSRLTLWVDGEPREAAFDAVSKVKAAYKEIAVVQRRDPVLVTMAGPDTVMVQCFPVPAGGEMKIRLGMTATFDGGLWEMPRILERNFGMKDSLQHAVWFQADQRFELAGLPDSTRTSHADGSAESMAVTLPGETIVGGPIAARLSAAAAPRVWCEDPFAPVQERFLVRESQTHRQPAAGRIVVVLDGSAALAAHRSWIVAALGRLSPADYELLVADDTARPVRPEELTQLRFAGGCDNEPALRQAVSRAKEVEGGAIVWIHGPQSVGLSQSEALRQMLERGSRLPVIYTVAATPGPNRLAEALLPSGVLRRGPTLLDPARDLGDFLSALKTEREENGWSWRRSAVAPTEGGTPVWDQLARSWAIGAIDSPSSPVPENERPTLAARYQLVTRVSGAVVLETREQYQRHGLEPVDPSAAPHIPGVPEASTLLLLLASFTALATRRRR